MARCIDGAGRIQTVGVRTQATQPHRGVCGESIRSVCEEQAAHCIDRAEHNSTQATQPLAACGVSACVLIEKQLKIAYGLDAIEIDQEGIHCIQGEFEVLSTHIKVKKAVIHALVFNELTLIFLAAHRLGKLGNVLVGNNRVCFAMKEKHWAETFFNEF